MNTAIAERITLETVLPQLFPEIVKRDREDASVIGALVLEPVSRAECMLSDIDDLARFRTEDGYYDPGALASIGQNKITAVKEGAIPYALSEVRHEWTPSPEGEGGCIRDLGRTAIQTALRGRLFYRHPESVARCDVEVNYARFNQEKLRPGVAHVMISPKMTPKDAPLHIAKSEGLADTDSIQVNWIEKGAADGEEAKTECILVSDVPIDAWVKMLEDETNIFGRAVPISDPDSALAVMEAYEQLEIPVGNLPEGPISILAAVVDYVDNRNLRKKVIDHIAQFRGNQVQMHETALSPAERWLQFDISTEQSLHNGTADNILCRFIESLENRWSQKDQAVIERHRFVEGHVTKYRMTRELASVLQNAQRNMILTPVAVVVGNKRVLDQMSQQAADRIYAGEIALKVAHNAGKDIQLIAQGMNSLIASQNVKVGGGCSGTNQANFLTEDDTNNEEYLAKTIKEKSWHGGKIKKGRCVNCKEITDVGVENWCKNCITCGND